MERVSGLAHMQGEGCGGINPHGLKTEGERRGGLEVYGGPGGTMSSAESFQQHQSPCGEVGHFLLLLVVVGGVFDVDILFCFSKSDLCLYLFYFVSLNNQQIHP